MSVKQLTAKVASKSLGDHHQAFQSVYAKFNEGEMPPSISNLLVEVIEKPSLTKAELSKYSYTLKNLGEGKLIHTAARELILNVMGHSVKSAQEGFHRDQLYTNLNFNKAISINEVAQQRQSALDVKVERVGKQLNDMMSQGATFDHPFIEGLPIFSSEGEWTALMRDVYYASTNQGDNVPEFRLFTTVMMIKYRHRIDKGLYRRKLAGSRINKQVLIRAMHNLNLIGFDDLKSV